MHNEIVAIKASFKFQCRLYCTSDSCNIGTSDLPDMYDQSPRAEGIHIRQITSAHVTTIM